MKEGKITVTREELEKLAMLHNKMLSRRMVFQKLGLAIFGLALGQFLAYACRAIWGTGPLKWYHWVYAAFCLLTVLITLVVLPYNSRCIKAHFTARDGMLGMLNTQPETSARLHHVDQAQAALSDLSRLYGERQKSSREGGP